jgi:MFS family permease
MVLRMTIHERWPYLGLVVIALLVPVLPPGIVVALAFLMVSWHALGGGVTATAWQSMLGKIIPNERIGTFFGTQSAAASLLSSGGAVVAGFILASVPAPYNFALCFGLAAVAMAISYVFLALTHEPEHPAPPVEETPHIGWDGMKRILRQDRNFRWYLVARALAAVAWVALNFYTVYAVRRFSMDEATAGFMTGLLMIGQAIANPILGWLGDRIGHRIVYALGAVLITISAACALFAPDLSWFYIVFLLAGFSNAASWATAMAATLEFGATSEKPLYIGLANTLIAPVTLLAPIIGGALAQALGYQATFAVCVLMGLLTAFTLAYLVRDPRPIATERETLSTAVSSAPAES